MITKIMIKSLRAAKKDLSHGAIMAFSVAIDDTKVVAAISIDARNKALVGGDFPRHFIYLYGMESDEIKAKIGETKERDPIEKAVEIKVAVVIFQRLPVGKPPHMLICGQPQSNNEVNDF